MKYIVPFLGSCLMAFNVCLFAGPLNPAQVDRHANWVCHMDMDTFKTTSLAGFFRQRSASAGWEEQMDTFKKRFSFHPIDNVHNVTLYGSDSEQENAIVLINADFDANTLIGLLPNHETVIYGPHTIHSWGQCKKEKKRGYGATWNYNVIIMAGRLERVQLALDVLDGTAPNAAIGSYISGYNAEPGQFLYARADQLSKIAKNDPEDVVLKQIEHLLMTAGEVNGKFQWRVDMGIPAQDKLTEVEQVCRGLLSYGFLSAENGRAELLPILRAIQVQPNAGLLSIYLDYSSAEIIDLAAKAAEYYNAQQKKEEASGGKQSAAAEKK